MKLVHYWMSRDPRAGWRFKAVCTKEWMVHTAYVPREEPLAYVSWHNKWDQPKDDRQFSSAFHEVTCAKCLDIIIPKKEAELEKMRASRALEIGL